MDTIKLTLHQGTYWLYDTTRKMNLSMRAETPEQAYRESILYYQKRLLAVEQELNRLKSIVDTFVDSVSEDEGY